jgi:hypothetical protein
MSVALQRSAALREYDHSTAAYLRDCASRAPAGRKIGEADVVALRELAQGVIEAMRAWSAPFEKLDLARSLGGRRPALLEPKRAGALVLESVFDELIDPGAWRVLAAALELETLE